MSAFKKLGVLIGCRDVVFAKCTKDDSTGITYDTEIKEAPGVIEIALTAQVSEDQLGADDNPYYEIVNSKDGFEVAVTQAALGSDNSSFLLGTTVDANGVEVENSADQAPYVAMGFKAARSDGTDDYIWLYKGKFAPGDQTYRTKEQGQVNWQTPTLNAKFGPRVKDGAIKARVNSGDDKASGVLASFFIAVYEKAAAQG